MKQTNKSEILYIILLVIYIMPIQGPPSRTPAVLNDTYLGIGKRQGVTTSIQDDVIEGEGVPKFFKNIGRAFTKTWNQKPTSQEKAILKPMLGTMSLATKVMGPVGAPANLVVDGLKSKYGVGLGANKGCGCSIGEKNKVYIKKA